jgi:hypothetical protein
VDTPIGLTALVSLRLAVRTPALGKAPIEHDANIALGGELPLEHVVEHRLLPGHNEEEHG